MLANRIIGAQSGDPYWSNVVALLHMDGTDGSTTFTDESGKRTITVGGSAQIDTAQSKFGGASGLFANATQDYLRFDGHADWQFGSGDFTVEFWVRKSANGGAGAYRRLFQTRDGDTYSALTLADNRAGSGNLSFSAGTTGTSSDLVSDADLGALALDTWTHFAVERFGVNITVYKDGDSAGNWNIGSSVLAWNSAWQPVLGGQSGTNRSFDGWIEESRVTKGFARYKGAFTPPDAPFPAG